MSKKEERVLGRGLAVEEMNSVAGGTSPQIDTTQPSRDTLPAADTVPVADTAPGPNDLSQPVSETGPTGGS